MLWYDLAMLSVHILDTAWLIDAAIHLTFVSY